jgi:hypothetical protein
MPDKDPGFLSGDVLAQAKTLMAVYRPWFSYRPDQAARMLPRTRYFSVSLYRIRPGADGDFAELLRARKDFFDSINLDRPEIAYQIISGTPSTTYLLLAPLTSLKSLDEGLARRPIRAEPRSGAANKAGVDIELSRSQLLFRVQPRMSYVSDEFAFSHANLRARRRRSRAEIQQHSLRIGVAANPAIEFLGCIARFVRIKMFVKILRYHPIPRSARLCI